MFGGVAVLQHFVKSKRSSSQILEVMSREGASLSRTRFSGVSISKDEILSTMFDCPEDAKVCNSP